MDLSSAKLNKINGNNLAFEGKKYILDEKGQELTRFILPYIKLEEGEKLGIEFLPFDKDGTTYKASNMKPIKYQDNSEEFKAFQKGKSNYIDINLSGLKRWNEYGYRYVIYDKQGNVKKTFNDNVATPVSTPHGDFTVASTKQGRPVIKGSMYHILTDSYNLPQEVRTALKRNHFNKAGGNINSIIDKLNNSDELDQYEYLMTTPILSGDKSYHEYHPENLFHVSRGMGTVQDFKNLQAACFDHGKRYIADGAYTSQGYQGLQLNHAMKWKDSTFKYWFKNPSNSGFAIGVLSDLPEVNEKYTGIRIVNPKNDVTYKYNPEMPTYVQFYDTRLASKEQLNNKGKLIEAYKNYDAADPFEITTWDDGTIQNWFEINPNMPAIKGRNVGSLIDWNKEGRLEKIINPAYEQYSFVRKGQVGGTTGWDGNIDLVKLNESNFTNSTNYIEGEKQVRNQVFNTALYWTELARDGLIEHIINNIHEINTKHSTIVNGREITSLDKYFNFIENTYELPNGTLQKISENLNGYNLKIANDKRSANEIIQDSILKFPLESLDYSNELLSVLSTPYITPRPSAKGNPAANKIEVLEDARKNTNTKFSKTMDEVYTEIIPKIVRNILNNLQSSPDAKNKFFNANGNDLGDLTEYGKYFVQMATKEVMQFAITESLFGESMNLPYKDGQIDFETLHDEFEQSGNKMNLKKLGIYEATPQAEAEAVAKKIKRGLLNLDDEKLRSFEKYLSNKYASYSEKEYKMSEAIINQTGAGLNWRFDAAKDVADWEEVKEGRITSEQAWDKVISFWKPFVKNVRDINPASYIVAEVTSLHDFNIYNWGKYKNADMAEKIFYEETGATTGSNYSTFFGAYPKLFGKSTESGAIGGYASISSFLQAAEGFCLPNEKQGHASSEFIQGSHVFDSNHDKPRTAHLMAVDAELFWSAFNKSEYKDTAEKYLKRPYNDNMSSKAVAVAQEYYKHFKVEAKKLGFSDKDVETLQKAITHLANGCKYCSNETKANYKKAEAFGNYPYEATIGYVLDQAESFGLNLKGKRKNLEEAVFKDMVTPFESKYIPMYELMLGTVGIPAVYTGTEFCQTGCETSSKNAALGCRFPTRHDYVKSKPHVKRFNERYHAAGMLAKQIKGMGALNNGTPVFMHPEKIDIIELFTKDSIIAGISDVNEKDASEACGFLFEGSLTKDEILSKLKSMDESEFVEQFKEHIKNEKNKGLKDWIIKNIRKYTEIPPEIGGICKYNDKGEVVFTVATNAFMPKDPENIPLLSAGETKGPEITKGIFKDKKGNLLAKPGSIFRRLEYNPDEKRYVDAGEFTYTKEGKLVSNSNDNPALNSTITYFYKVA